MSVVAPSTPAACGPARPRLRALPGSGRARRAPAALAAIVGVSAAVQALLAWARPTPGYFPDEYLYAELGRSLADGAGPLVRGGAAHFAPLLYPLLTAPAWLIDEVGTAYRAVQTLNAIVMSLAAVPVFLIARRLRLGDRLSLACAALSVAAPALLYSSWTMAEPLAYTLALAAVACAVAVLDRPTARLQLAFLTLAGLAAFTRLQLAAIPLCYLLAAAVVGLRERRLRAQLAEQRLALGALGAAVIVAGVAGLRGHFGYYPSFTYVTVEPLDAVRGVATNSLVLAYSTGWVAVPAALLGLALALARPRSRAELAFGALAAVLVPALVAQASLYGDTENVQERYVVYAVPVLVLAFALYVQRGWPLLRAHALLAAGGAAVVALVPLAGYAAGPGSAQSLLLSAHQGAALALGDVGLASLVFALAASTLPAVVLAVAWRHPRRAGALGLGVTLAVLVALTTAAFSFYQHKRTALRSELLPHDPSWVDRARVGDVTLLLSPRGTKADTHTTLFWNRSVDRLLLAPGAAAPDAFAASGVSVDGAGRLSADGRPVTGALLVDVYGASVELRDAMRLAEGPTKVLWRPRGVAQLGLLMVGRYYDGWVAAEGAVRIWPVRAGGRLAGWLELELTLPRGAPPSRIRMHLPDRATVTRSAGRGRPQLLRVPVCGAGVWTAAFETAATGVAHGGRVGPRAGSPRFVADAAAC